MKRKFLFLLLIGALSLLPAGCTFKDTIRHLELCGIASIFLFSNNGFTLSANYCKIQGKR